MKKICFAILLVPFCLSGLHAQDKSLSAFQKKRLVWGADTLPYRILYPQKYKKHKVYPLIVFLHGSGERGSDNSLQLLHGGNLFVRKNIRKYFPAIVVFPQCPKDSAWSRYERTGPQREISFPENAGMTRPEEMVKYLIDSLVTAGVADDRRIYLGGLSLGGFGTYDLLTRYPDYFAAAFPICGAANIPVFLHTVHETPIWIFHGGKDDIVPPGFDRDLIKALMTRGQNNASYTEYPMANHNSWDSAFAEPKLLPWLFEQKKKRMP